MKENHKNITFSSQIFHEIWFILTPCPCSTLRLTMVGFIFEENDKEMEGKDQRLSPFLAQQRSRVFTHSTQIC